MAVDYGTLFGRLGAIVRCANSFITSQGTLLMNASVGADSILDLYNDRRDLVTTVQTSFQGWATAMGSWASALKTVADTTLLDLQADLAVQDRTVTSILSALVDDMVLNGQTVNASVVSTPSITNGYYNVGTGTLVVSEVNAEGNDDERIITENIVAVCVTDRFNGASAGNEVFNLTGLPVYPVTDGWHSRGRGAGSSLRCVTSSSMNRIKNGGFETFSVTDTPNDWTIAAGVVTTSIKQEQTNVHGDLSALNLHGNHTATTITVTQTLSGIGLVPGRRMVAGAYARKRNTFGAGASNLQIAITGTGFTTVDLFNADPDTLTTSYALKHAWFTVPAVIPSDFLIKISWTTANAPDTGAEVLVDDVAVAYPVDFGHAYYALFRGDTDFVVGDSFAIANANDGDGVFQEFFGRFYDVLLPSAAGGAETIADSLAT